MRGLSRALVDQRPQFLDIALEVAAASGECGHVEQHADPDEPVGRDEKGEMLGHERDHPAAGASWPRSVSTVSCKRAARRRRRSNQKKRRKKASMQASNVMRMSGSDNPVPPSRLTITAG